MVVAEKKLKEFLDDPNLKNAVKYIEMNKKNGGVLSIGNIDVDVNNIIKRPFLCNPAKCVNLTKARKKDNSCCTDHEVMCSKSEKKSIAQLIKKYNNDVKEVMTKGFNLKNIFKANDDYDGVDYEIKKNTFSACALSFHSNDNEIRCLIEYICRKHHLPVLNYKPMWCYMWPMSFIKYDEKNNRYFLTAYTMETRKVFDLAKADIKFKCVNNPDKSDPPFFRSMKNVIILMFGNKFYNKLEKYYKETVK